LSGQTLRHRIRAAAAGKLTGAGGKVVTLEAMQLSRLRSDVARLKRENEIIKSSVARSTGRCNTLLSNVGPRGKVVS